MPKGQRFFASQKAVIGTIQPLNIEVIELTLTCGHRVICPRRRYPSWKEGDVFPVRRLACDTCSRAPIQDKH